MISPFKRDASISKTSRPLYDPGAFRSQNIFNARRLSRVGKESICPLSQTRSVVVLLRGRARGAVTVVPVAPGQHAQLFQGLLEVCHLGPLREEAGGHAADVEGTGAVVKLA